MIWWVKEGDGGGGYEAVVVRVHVTNGRTPVREGGAQAEDSQGVVIPARGTYQSTVRRKPAAIQEML